LNNEPILVGRAIVGAILGAYIFFTLMKKSYNSYSKRKGDYHFIENTINIWATYLWAAILGLVFGNPIVEFTLSTQAVLVASIAAVVGINRLLTVIHSETIAETMLAWQPSAIGIFVFASLYSPAFASTTSDSLLSTADPGNFQIPQVAVIITLATVFFVEVLAKVVESKK
jgi:hypothetical protein